MYRLSPKKLVFVDKTTTFKVQTLTYQHMFEHVYEKWLITYKRKTCITSTLSKLGGTKKMAENSGTPRLRFRSMVLIKKKRVVVGRIQGSLDFVYTCCRAKHS